LNIRQRRKKPGGVDNDSPLGGQYSILGISEGTGEEKTSVKGNLKKDGLAVPVRGRGREKRPTGKIKRRRD